MIVFDGGYFSCRTCRPSDLDSLFASHEATLQAVMNDLGAQLERDRTADYLALSDGARVLVVEAGGQAVGVVAATIKGVAATIACRTIPGAVHEDEAWTFGLHAQEYVRSLGCTSATVNLHYHSRATVTETHDPIEVMPAVYGGLALG